MFSSIYLNTTEISGVEDLSFSDIHLNNFSHNAYKYAFTYSIKLMYNTIFPQQNSFTVSPKKIHADVSSLEDTNDKLNSVKSICFQKESHT